MPYKDPERQREYMRQWMARRRLAYFDGKRCADCDSTDDLQLDHLDPAEKENGGAVRHARAGDHDLPGTARGGRTPSPEGKRSLADITDDEQLLARLRRAFGGHDSAESCVSALMDKAAETAAAWYAGQDVTP